jgi:coatomer protein complex subunit alpha (xenin)
LKNEETKRCPPPHPIDGLFPAPLGCLLLRSEDKVTLYDVQQKRSLAEINATDIRYAFWSNDKSPLVALVGKDSTFCPSIVIELSFRHYSC